MFSITLIVNTKTIVFFKNRQNTLKKKLSSIALLGLPRYCGCYLITRMLTFALALALAEVMGSLEPSIPQVSVFIFFCNYLMGNRPLPIGLNNEELRFGH